MITLTDDEDHKTVYPSGIQQCGDVAKHFNIGNLANAGFESVIIQSIPVGTYHVGLAGRLDKKVYDCNNTILPLVAK